MARFRLKYVHSDRDRHGNIRHYFKRGPSPKTRLHGLPGSEEFMSGYHNALAGLTLPPMKSQGRVDSLEWLCNAFYRSSEFRGQADGTRASKRRIYRLICAEPLSPSSNLHIGDMPYREMSAKHVRTLRDWKAETPHAANNWIKALRALFKWAIEEEHAAHNPARDVPLLRVVSEGFHTWTLEEMRQFEAAHPIGGQARLAMALMAFTGQRRSDVIRLGPQHARAGRFRFTQKKNETRHPVVVEIPILPVLAEIISASVCGTRTYLIGETGAPWSNGGFGNKFHGWCVEADLPHCSAHGLRKAASCAAAEGGATELQMMAIFGWRSPAMARRYTLKASQRKMADATMHLLG